MIQIDIQMPKCCDECFALDDNGDYPFCLISHDQRGYNFNTRERRMPTCLLKELKDDGFDESVAPLEEELYDTIFWKCGNCGEDLFADSMYCMKCGRMVKWNDDCVAVATVRWIPVTTRLPKSLKRVLIAIKCKYTGGYYITTGSHCNDHEITTEEYGWQDYEGDTEYDEDKDCFWVKGGWWETNFVEDNQNWEIDEVDGVVEYWAELPELNI